MKFYQDPSDDTLVFTAQESKEYHLAEPEKATLPHATVAHPVWMTFDGEWIQDNGEW